MPGGRINEPLFVDVDVQKSVAARGSIVHFLTGHLAIAHASIDHGCGLVEALDRNLGQRFDIDLTVRLFANVQILAFIRIEQISNSVLIDLEQAHVHLPRNEPSLCFLPFKVAQNLLDRLRNNPKTLTVDFIQYTHRVRLSRTCLPINEVSAIIAVQDCADKWLGGHLVDLLLLRLCIEDVVETEILHRLFWQSQLNILVVLLIREATLPLSRIPAQLCAAHFQGWIKYFVVQFALKWRPDPDKSLHTLDHFLVGAEYTLVVAVDTRARIV